HARRRTVNGEGAERELAEPVERKALGEAADDEGDVAFELGARLTLVVRVVDHGYVRCIEGARELFAEHGSVVEEEDPQGRMRASARSEPPVDVNMRPPHMSRPSGRMRMPRAASTPFDFVKMRRPFGAHVGSGWPSAVYRKTAI